MAQHGGTLTEEDKPNEAARIGVLNNRRLAKRGRWRGKQPSPWTTSATIKRTREECHAQQPEELQGRKEITSRLVRRLFLPPPPRCTRAISVSINKIIAGRVFCRVSLEPPVPHPSVWWRSLGRDPSLIDPLLQKESPHLLILPANFFDEDFLLELSMAYWFD